MVGRQRLWRGRRNSITTCINKCRIDTCASGKDITMPATPEKSGAQDAGSCRIKGLEHVCNKLRKSDIADAASRLDAADDGKLLSVA